MADRARHLEADRSDLIERSDLARKIVEEHRYESPYAARRGCVCGICKIGAALQGTSEFEERLTAEMRKPLRPPAEQVAGNLRVGLAIEEMGRTVPARGRSEEGGGGTECGRTCRIRGCQCL